MFLFAKEFCLVTKYNNAGLVICSTAHLLLQLAIVESNGEHFHAALWQPFETNQLKNQKSAAGLEPASQVFPTMHQWRIITRSHVFARLCLVCFHSHHALKLVDVNVKNCTSAINIFMNENQTVLCSYGCNNEAKFYITKNNKPCCSQAYNKCPALRAKNSEGTKRSYTGGVHSARKRVSGHERYLNMSQETKDKMAWNRNKNVVTDERIRGSKDIFVENSYATSSRVRKLLYDLNLRERKCECCQITDWQGLPVVFELHHLNGISSDNRIENLLILCPNCHSQTENFRGKKNKSCKEVNFKTDEQIIEALQKCNYNRRQALILLGLAPKGGNYKRLNKFIKVVDEEGFEPSNYEF